MELNSFMPLILAAIGGGGLAALANYLLGKKKSEQDGFSMIFKKYEEDNKRLREAEAENRKELADLRGQVDELRRRQNLMDGSHSDLPIPHWIKTLDGSLITVNKSCYEVFIEPFGVSELDVVGKTDHEIFPQEIADYITLNDNEMVRKKRPITFIEDFVILGIPEKWCVIRYPIIKENVVIAKAGVAYKIPNHTEKNEY